MAKKKNQQDKVKKLVTSVVKQEIPVVHTRLCTESRRVKKRQTPSKYHAPKYLSDVGIAKYNQLYELLESQKVITPSDVIALEILCVNYEMYLDLHHAMVLESTDGTVKGYFAVGTQTCWT